MDNPLRYLCDEFRQEFEVRFVIERMDDSLLLLLCDAGGVRVRRMLSGRQLADRQRLEQVVQSIRFGLEIDRGRGRRGLQRLSRKAGLPPL
jgi:hypothetical protein